MRKRLVNLFCLLVCMSLLCSCAPGPRLTVHQVRQIERAIAAEKIVFVFDLTGRNRHQFQEYFIDTFTWLTQDTAKQLSIMTGYEYAQSPYHEPARAEAFDDVLFIYVKVDGSEQGEYDTCTVTYLMTIQYQGQDPLFVEEISLGFANPYLESQDWQGHKLAEMIYEELSKRNIL